MSSTDGDVAALRAELRALLRGDGAERAWASDRELFDLADRAHLLPTLDFALEDLIGELPTEHARPIVVRRLAHRSSRLRYLATFGRVMEILDDSGVRFVVLKGLANEQRWYRPGERRMSDIDIAVHPADLYRVGDLARQISVGPTDPGPAIDALRAGAVSAIDLDAGAVSVDLHSRVFKALGPARTESLVWDRGVTVAVPLGDGGDHGDGVRVPVLDPSSALVHATLHALIDRFCFLTGPADMVRMLEREHLDWDFVASFAAAEGWTDPVAFGIWRAGELGAVAADRIGIDAPPTRRRHELLWPGELIAGGRDAWHRSNWRSKLMPFAVEGRRLAAARAIGRSMFPSDEYLRYRYGELGGSRAGRLLRWQSRWLRENRARQA